MTKPRVLFACTHNGARSRIAEEFTKRYAQGRVEVYSASFESEKIGPIPVEVMNEVGIELPTSSPKSVFEWFKTKEKFDYVVSISDPFAQEQASIFTSSVDSLYHKTARRFSWIIPNFRALSGTDEEKKAKARKIRGQIKAEVCNFLSALGVEIVHPDMPSEKE